MNNTQAASSQPDHVSGIARSTLIVIAGSILSFGVGLVRQRIVAQYFGITADFDAYTAADGLSELLVYALGAGTLVYAFTPIYIEFLEKKDTDYANTLVSQVFNLIILLAFLAAMGAMALAPLLVSAPWGLAPGYTPEIQSITIRLLRILMVSMIIFTGSSLVTGVLHAHRHFWLPAITPVVYYCGIIFGTLVLAPTMGIDGLAWGAVLGSLLHFLVQVPGLIYFRVNWKPVLHLGDTNLHKVLILMLPRVIDLVMARASLTWLGDNLTSHLGEGRLSALGMAYRVMNIPWTLIGTALGFAVFPVMASLAAQHDIAAQRKALSGSLRAVITFAIPSAVGLVLLGRPFIQMIFEGGEFTAASTDLVFYALQFYAVTLISQSMLDIVVRAFAAQKDTWTPLIVSFFTTALNIAFAVMLTRSFARGGIEQGGPALANGIAVGIESITGLIILHIRWKGIDAPNILRGALKAVAGSVLMGIAIVAFNLVVHTSTILGLGLSTALGVGIYLGAEYLLGVKEVVSIPLKLLRSATWKTVPG